MGDGSVFGGGDSPLLAREGGPADCTKKVNKGIVKKEGAVLVKTNVLLVLPNKLAELGAVYDCLH